MHQNVIRKIHYEPNTGCWLWGGALSDNGYGNFCIKINGKAKCLLAHRYVYNEIVGGIPLDLDLDHKCRVRSCVNPDHLEPVTRKENINRGVFPSIAGRHNLIKTNCPNGHSYDEANTRIKRQGKYFRRVCRECENSAKRIKRKIKAERILN